jgi:flagellar motor switch protein FliN/FliY
VCYDEYDGENFMSEDKKGSLALNEITEDAGAREAEQEYNIGEAMAGDVTAIYDVPVQISAVLGKSTMQVSQLLKLGRGAVVELDRKVGEAIDIYVNNRLVARGEVVVVEDKLGVTMTEIVKSDRV